MQRIESMEQRVMAPKAPEPTGPTPPADWIDKVADPVAMKAEVQGWIKEAIAPVLMPIAEATKKAGEADVRGWVVDEYGQEFWDEHVAPRYGSIMDQLRQTNPVATISPEHIQTVVSSIVGGRELSKQAAQARAKAEQTKAAARTPAPRFVGPGRPTLPDHETLSDEDRAIMARIQHSLGKDAISEKEILEGRKNRAREAG